MTLTILTLRTRKYKQKQNARWVTSYKSAMHASYVTSPTTTGPKGPMPCNEAIAEPKNYIEINVKVIYHL